MVQHKINAPYREAVSFNELSGKISLARHLESNPVSTFKNAVLQRTSMGNHRNHGCPNFEHQRFDSSHSFGGTLHCLSFGK